ncbi:MAG: zinc dependent phospholipase C family protein [Atopobiaceae bacterium]|jgi:hypothetical protein
MPSWNIHTAHVEHLLSEFGAPALGIQDPNAFLFGNMVPDIYVGYMVPDVSFKIRYRTTHFAEPSFIPSPHFDYYAAIYVDGRAATDMELGAWTHLVADNVYNTMTREYIASVGVAPGEKTRVRKQGDFDLFGHTLNLTRTCQLNDALIDEAARFSEYPIAEEDVRKTVAVARGIVEDTVLHHVSGTPDYSLLTPEFFAHAFDRVNRICAAGLLAHARMGTTAAGVASLVPDFRTLTAQEALVAVAEAERRGAASDARAAAEGHPVPFSDEVVPVTISIPATLAWRAHNR